MIQSLTQLWPTTSCASKLLTLTPKSFAFGRIWAYPHTSTVCTLNIVPKRFFSDHRNEKPKPPKISFKEFVENKVKPFAQFQESPDVKESCENDIEKMKTAYEGYCKSRYTRYKTGSGPKPAKGLGISPGEKSPARITGFEEKTITFEEFKEKKVKSFDEFCRSSGMQLMCGSDLRKIVAFYDKFRLNSELPLVCGTDLGNMKVIYERYCLSRYALYKATLYGGNPGLMI